MRGKTGNFLPSSQIQSFQILFLRPFLELSSGVPGLARAGLGLCPWENQVPGFSFPPSRNRPKKELFIQHSAPTC